MTTPPKDATLGLRCDPKLVEQVLDRADAASPDPGHTLRHHRRTSCRGTECRVTLSHPGSPTPVTFAVALRNLSPGGASFLVRSFLHKDTACQILMVDRSRNAIKATGRVVRCRYLEHMLHEVALAFDEKVDPTVLCSNTEPTSVLFVDGDTAWEEPLAERLGPDSGIEITRVATIKDALAEVAKVFYDCVVFDVAGAGEGKAQSAADLRAKFPRTLLAALDSENVFAPAAETPAEDAGGDAEAATDTPPPPDLRKELMGAGVTEIIERPYDLEALETILKAVRA